VSHVEERDAAGIVMLALDDPQRVDAFEHASRCARCRAELASAERMLSALSALDERAQSLAADELARLERRVVDAIAASTTEARRATALLVMLGVVTLAGALLVALAPLVSEATSVRSAFALKCSLTELGAALLPFGVLAYLRRRSALGALEGALATGVGALAGELWLVSACPDHDLSHQLVFHAGAVVLASALGALGSVGLRAARSL
jgi:hypothetical protein